jgi:hypothetical protein
MKRISVKTCMSVTYRTGSKNLQRHKMLSVHYEGVTKRFVTVYLLRCCTLCDVYVLKTLRFVQIHFVTLRHVKFTLCCFTLCSNIRISIHVHVDVGFFARKKTQASVFQILKIFLESRCKVFLYEFTHTKEKRPSKACFTKKSS